MRSRPSLASRDSTLAIWIRISSADFILAKRVEIQIIAQKCVVVQAGNGTPDSADSLEHVLDEETPGLRGIDQLLFDDCPAPRGDSSAGDHVSVNAEQEFDPLRQIHEPETDRRVDLHKNIHVAGLGLLTAGIGAE